MMTLTATEFVNNFGKRNQEVQREPIEVTSHGRPVGYYVSAHDFESMERALKSILTASVRRGMADIRRGNHRAYDGEQLLQESLQHIAARRKK
jgi:prevent-host-death family protein